jgi:hypothetical protein
MAMMVPCCTCTALQALNVAKPVCPGQELVWDYNAVSDDPHDPLCREPCRCRALRGPDAVCAVTPLAVSVSQSVYLIRLGQPYNTRRLMYGLLDAHHVTLCIQLRCPTRLGPVQ